MKITIHYTTQLKAALGNASEVLDVDRRATVVDVVSLLCDRHGDVLNGLLYDDEGQLLPSVLVCVGDEQVPIDDPAELQDGACVTLLSAISGG